MFLPFVVIRDLDVVGIPVPPLETNPPWTVHRYGPLAFPVPLQRVKMDTPERRDICQLSGRAQDVQSFKGQFNVHTTEAGCPSLLEEPGRGRILETLDHTPCLLRLA